MALQDFTTYTEVDPNSKITVTSAKVDVVALANVDDAYVYDDKGAAHFDGDFKHHFEVYTSSTGGYECGTYAMSNNVGSRKNHKDNSWSFYQLASYRGSQFSLDEWDTATNYRDSWTGASGSTLYYITMVRDESVGTYGTLYCYIYTDSDRTSLSDTLVITLHSSKKDFQYVYGWFNNGEASSTYSGYTQNLDLNEDTENTHSATLAKASSQYFSKSHASQVGLNIGTGSDDFTVEAWIKPTDPTTGADGWLVSKWEGTNRGWFFGYGDDGGTNRFRIGIRNSGDSAHSIQTYDHDLGTDWTHVAFIYDNSAGSIKIRVDGSDLTTLTSFPVGVLASVSAFAIGADGAGGSLYDGQIDDVRIWGDIRTDAEIDDNEDNLDLSIGEAGLISWWKFNDNGFDSASENDNNLVNNGSTTFTTDVPYASITESDVSDTITITEDVAIDTNYDISVSDAITIVDIPFYYEETVFISESIEILVFIDQNDADINDTITVSEDITVGITSFVSVSDNISLAEDVTINNTQLGGIDVSEDISVTELITMGSNMNISADDAVTISEDIVSVATIADISVSDDVTILESVSITQIYGVSVFDLISVTEEVVIANEQLGGIDVSDSINITEDVAIVKVLDINKSDSITISESVSAENEQLGGIDVQETITISELVQIGHDYSLSIEDAIGIGESIISENTQLGGIDVNDGVAISEDVYITNTQLGGINVNDAVTISEDIEMNMFFPVSVSDSVTISEDVEGFERIRNPYYKKRRVYTVSRKYRKKRKMYSMT